MEGLDKYQINCLMNIVDIQETITGNFRISHIVQKNDYDMLRPHLHREYELYYLIAGERTYFIEDRVYTVHLKTLLVIIHKNGVGGVSSFGLCLIIKSKELHLKGYCPLRELIQLDMPQCT